VYSKNHKKEFSQAGFPPIQMKAAAQVASHILEALYLEAVESAEGIPTASSVSEAGLSPIQMKICCSSCSTCTKSSIVIYVKYD